MPQMYGFNKGEHGNIFVYAPQTKMTFVWFGFYFGHCRCWTKREFCRKL